LLHQISDYRLTAFNDSEKPQVTLLLSQNDFVAAKRRLMTVKSLN
jgi:hypothetical protein